MKKEHILRWKNISELTEDEKRNLRAEIGMVFQGSAFLIL